MKVRELLAKPEAWTKRRFAKAADGSAVTVMSDQAVCWCLRGAVYKCYANQDDCDLVEDKLQEAMQKLKGDEYHSLTHFNDDPKTTYADILDVCEAADV